MAPFRLKWAGGKRWLADALIASLGPAMFEAGLCEPFAGGAALSFAAPGLGPLHLADTNLDLIETYRAIQRAPHAIAAELAALPIEASIFDQMRSHAPSTNLERAVRTIYLNRTAFNGLWRVNALGEFNVPFGCKPKTRLPTKDELLATSTTLARAKLEVSDFEVSARNTTAPTIYFDPPYTVSHNHNGFVRYNERIFSWEDQQRLAEVAENLVSQGQSVIISNALHVDVRKLYRDGPFKLYKVSRQTSLAANAVHRGVVEELLVVSRNVRIKRLPSFASRIDR